MDAHHPFKYLGVHITLTLDESHERNYIIKKTKEAITPLLHTCFSTHQILRLLDMCVIPIFRYSAALIVWTPADLERIDSLWDKVRRAAYRLTPSAPRALFHLPESSGGLGYTTAASIISSY